ncbi:MAG: 50S ribosomal protein L22 [Parcubacteria group bacterium]|nr:50S ribosomal protein L22 [Parcubacteria group bacterium]
MKAYLKNYRQAPRKVRLIADLVRGKKVDRALTLLSATDKKATLPFRKLVESAVANAKSSGAKKEDLIVKEIQVNEGIVFKRYKPRARGRASAIRKKTSHISVVLGEKKNKEMKAKAETKKPVAKKAKPAAKKVPTSTSSGQAAKKTIRK